MGVWRINRCLYWFKKLGGKLTNHALLVIVALGKVVQDGKEHERVHLDELNVARLREGHEPG